VTKNKGRETEARGPPNLGFQRIQCKAADGSILVVRIFGGLMNLDAFLAFSAMRVRFVQVTGRAFPQGRSRRRLPFALHKHFGGACAVHPGCSAARLRCSAAWTSSPYNVWS